MLRQCVGRSSASSSIRSRGRGCAAGTLSCLHRPLDLLIQTCFRHQQALPFCHQSSIHSQRHETVPSPHPKTCPFRRVLPYRIRHLGTTATPLRRMTGNPPTIVLPRKPAVSSWALCCPQHFSTGSFQSLEILNNIQSPWGISRKFWTHLKRSTCTPHLLAYS